MPLSECPHPSHSCPTTCTSEFSTFTYSYVTVTKNSFSFSKSILANFSQRSKITNPGCKMLFGDQQQVWDMAYKFSKDPCPLPTLLHVSIANTTLPSLIILKQEWNAFSFTYLTDYLGVSIWGLFLFFSKT